MHARAFLERCRRCIKFYKILCTIVSMAHRLFFGSELRKYEHGTRNERIALHAKERTRSLLWWLFMLRINCGVRTFRACLKCTCCCCSPRAHRASVCKTKIDGFKMRMRSSKTNPGPQPKPTGTEHANRADVRVIFLISHVSNICVSGECRQIVPDKRSHDMCACFRRIVMFFVFVFFLRNTHCTHVLFD